MNAQLPPDAYESTVGSMEPGEVRYAVPWAVVVDEGGDLWINPMFGTCDEPGGTACMEILRTPTGVEAVVPRGQFAWSPRSISGDVLPVERFDLSNSRSDLVRFRSI